jgi:hypothetical protein
MAPTYPLYRWAEARRLAGAAGPAPDARALGLAAGGAVLAGLTLWRLTRARARR